ncbi:putative peptidase T [Monocercomonoides exilis]|uniref:putative peptidase T n=1 Tax=Monocercomonoides exilis TaxID=2049356 RepID=UPI00355ABB24|nr:putative peptidase T [Monocercomonoides exilis]
MSSACLTEQDIKELVDRFIRYCKIDSQSAHDVEKVPTTEKQFEMAKLLVKELSELGLEAKLSDKCSVCAIIPGNAKASKTIGLNSHVDVSPDAPSQNIQPMIHHKISGKDLRLPSGTVIPGADLSFYEGQDIITSDGSTLLGADDKAGVASIMQFVTIIQRAGTAIPHGDIYILFTSDEEVGKGADSADMNVFKPDVAFTVDGGRIGEYECETFSAYGCTLRVTGVDIHPGSAYQVMVNAAKVASEFTTLLPQDQAPETTKEKEGFIHVTSMEGDVSEATVQMIIRDFEDAGLQAKIETINSIVKSLKEKHPKAVIEATFKKQYSNMIKYILPEHAYLLEHLEAAIRESGVTPNRKPIRGGTDGARFSELGIPTPNIFAGGENFHSKREFVSIQSLSKVPEVLLRLVQKFVIA